MVQLNLLPDVKAKYVKTERTKHTVVLSAVVVSGVALAIVFLLAFIVFGAQKLQLSNLDGDIKEKSAELNKIEDLDKILTIQNQLNALDGLHAQKPVTGRIFTFLPQIVPNDVAVSDYSLKFDTSTMIFTGTGKDFASVNKFVDTLKFTKYKTDTSETEKNAFSEVVLSTFSKSDKSASYTVTLKYDPALFAGSNKTVTLVVPNITSTRSTTERPNNLFIEQPKQTTEAN